MMQAWHDPRIINGTRQQLRLRRELLAAGKKQLGWKLAFGGPVAMQRLQINAPLVGFLMQDAVVASGSVISFAGWKKPAAEPEITVYLGKDVPPKADRKTIMSAIAGLGAAIEVADVDHPSDDVEGTLARNIYQRHLARRWRTLRTERAGNPQRRRVCQHFRVRDIDRRTDLHRRPRGQSAFVLSRRALRWTNYYCGLDHAANLGASGREPCLSTGAATGDFCDFHCLSASNGGL